MGVTIFSGTTQHGCFQGLTNDGSLDTPPPSLPQRGDADYLREQMLYDMTLRAQQSVRENRLAKRALCRLLHTSPAQVYRLLDQTCYSKTVDQMLRLLQVLGCTVKLEISL